MVLAWVVYEFIANEVRSAELAMSSYTRRANGITVLLYRQTRYFWCYVVKQLPNSCLLTLAKRSAIFFSTTNRIWSDSLLVEEPIKLHNSSYTVFVYIIMMYIPWYISKGYWTDRGQLVVCITKEVSHWDFTLT